MARTDTLGHFLTDVADAIRTKTGSQATIQASSFDTAIENIPSGGDLSDYFDNKITGGNNSNSPGWMKIIKKFPTTLYTTSGNFSYAFTKFSGTSVPLFDTSTVSIMDGAFMSCSNLITVPLYNTANVQSMGQMFQSCTSLTSVPLFDMSSCNGTNQMFDNCSSLTSIPQFDMSHVQFTGRMFYGCLALTDIPQLNLSKMINAQNMFQGCNSLTNTSLNNILYSLTHATAYINQGTNMTLSWFGINADQRAICQTLSNYQDFIDAGWSGN